MLRTRAEERDLLREPRDDTTHALDAPVKGAAVADVVVTRKHGHRRVRVAARKLEHAQEHAGASIEVSGLHQDVARVETSQLGTCDHKMIAIDDRERSLGTDKRCNPRQGRLQQRPRSQYPTVLLRDRRAGDQMGETL